MGRIPDLADASAGCGTREARGGGGVRGACTAIPRAVRGILGASDAEGRAWGSGALGSVFCAAPGAVGDAARAFVASEAFVDAFGAGGAGLSVLMGDPLGDSVRTLGEWSTPRDDATCATRDDAVRATRGTLPFAFPPAFPIAFPLAFPPAFPSAVTIAPTIAPVVVVVGPLR